MRTAFYLLTCWLLLLQACTVIRLCNGSPEAQRISIVSSDSISCTESYVIERFKKSTQTTTNVTLSRFNHGCILEFNLQPNRSVSINYLIMPEAGHDQTTKFCILDKAGIKDTLISVQGNKVEQRLFTKKFKLLWNVYHYKIR